MTFDDFGLQFLERLEGRRAHAYLDVADYLTIGVGHLLSPSEKSRGTILLAGKPVTWGNGLSTEQMDALLRQDSKWACDDIEKAVKVALTQHQFDALTCFVFNVGGTNFLGDEHHEPCGVLRAINRGDYDSVPKEMQRWVYARKKKLPGLVTRRAKESTLWSTP